MPWSLLLLQFACGAAAGAAAASRRRAWRGDAVAYGASTPHATAVTTYAADAGADASPPSVRAVIVGGGYAGSKLAFYLDSLFDVTLIDEKNYYEYTPDVVPLLCRAANGDDDDNKDNKDNNDNKNDDGEDAFVRACRRSAMLHRRCLRHANVVTGTVDGVDDARVYLRDGRAVPYDLLVVATGERKPFPLHTRHARTLAARMRELRALRARLRRCRGKVAVLGGGPAAVALTRELALARPDLDVHMYYARDEVLPAMPRVCRAHAARALRGTANVHLHPRTRVTDVRGRDAAGRVVATAARRDDDGNGGGNDASWWRRLRGGGRRRGGDGGRARDSDANEAAASYSDKHGRADDDDDDDVRCAPPPVCYDVCVATLRGGAALATPSILAQVLLPRQRRLQQPRQQQAGGGDEDDDDVCETRVDDGYAHVFSLLGDTPRPIVAGAGKPNVLRAHETADGHYRASTLCQLLGRPHVFALGRCNNLPLTRCYGTSDAQVRMLFRALAAIALGNGGGDAAAAGQQQPSTSSPPYLLQPRDALKLPRLRALPPRFAVRLGPRDAVASTPWAGGVVGRSAVADCDREVAYLLREFRQPVSFKRPDAAAVRARVAAWRANEVTDITDFSHC